MLSWPSWLTCSGWFTHISGHPSAAGRAQDRESSPVRDRRSTTVPRHQLASSDGMKNAGPASKQFYTPSQGRSQALLPGKPMITPASTFGRHRSQIILGSLLLGSNWLLAATESADIDYEQENTITSLGANGSCVHAPFPARRSPVLSLSGD